MRHWLPHAVLLGVALVLSLPPAAAVAQAPINPRGVPGYNTPAVSPYINLLRTGSPQAVNYYGIVRPEIQFRNSLQNLQQQVTDIGTATAETGTTSAAPPPTGHAVSFLNYSHYYGGLGGATSLPGRTSSSG